MAKELCDEAGARRRGADVAIDDVGNVCVADRSNHTIRKVTAAGVLTTLAGTGGSTWQRRRHSPAARFNHAGAAVDSGGNVAILGEPDPTGGEPKHSALSSVWGEWGPRS